MYVFVCTDILVLCIDAWFFHSTPLLNSFKIVRVQLALALAGGGIILIS